MNTRIHRIVYFGIGLIVLLALWVPSVMAAGRYFCKQYADKAIAQFNEAREAGCKDINYPVWSDDFNHHYNWCTTVSESQAMPGTKTRQDVLNQCKGATTSSVPPPNLQQGYLDNVNLVGGDIGVVWEVNKPGRCEASCNNTTDCKSWTWVRPGALPGIVRPGLSGFCALKGAAPKQTNNNCCVSGYMSKQGRSVTPIPIPGMKTPPAIDPGIGGKTPNRKPPPGTGRLKKGALPIPPPAATRHDTAFTNLVLKVDTVNGVHNYDGQTVVVRVRNIGLVPVFDDQFLVGIRGVSSAKPIWYGKTSGKGQVIGSGKEQQIYITFKMPDVVSMADMEAGRIAGDPSRTIDPTKQNKPSVPNRYVAVVDIENQIAEGGAGEKDNISAPFSLRKIDLPNLGKFLYKPLKKKYKVFMPQLDGSFTITSVKPHVVKGILKRVDVVIEADSKNEWAVQDGGHHKYGSMWLELKVINKVVINRVRQDRIFGHMFSANGKAAGNEPFLAPKLGKTFPKGKQKFVLSVLPTRDFGQPSRRTGFAANAVSGVQEMWSESGGLFQPGKIKCRHYYPEMVANVYIVNAMRMGHRESKKIVIGYPHDVSLTDLPVSPPGGNITLYNVCKK